VNQEKLNDIFYDQISFHRISFYEIYILYKIIMFINGFVMNL